MQSKKNDFIEFLLKKEVLQFGEFILKSNRKSPYFFNSGLFNTGQDLLTLGRFYAKKLIDSNIDFDLLFGPAYKGIPLTIATAIALEQDYHRNVSCCFNRKENKDHGEGGMLIGQKPQGKIVLIDDVISTGIAISESMKIIHSYENVTLSAILVALDRKERSTGKISTIQELQNKYKCKVISIITLHELIDYLKSKSDMQQSLIKINDYYKMYGI